MGHDRSTPKPGVQRRVLLAEDSEDIQRLIAACLEPTAHQLEIAGNGQAALDKFMAGNFDLVLMDSEMPVMDGFTATRRMRAWEAQRDGPPVIILALTGGAISEEFRGLCDGYLTKPIRLGTLVRALEDYGSIEVAHAASGGRSETSCPDISSAARPISGDSS